MRLGAGLVLLAAAALVAGCGGSGHGHSHAATVAPPPVPPATTAPPALPPPPPASAPAPPAVPMSWRTAGTFVWHPTSIDPTLLGSELRTNGFGWAAIFLHDGLTSAPVDPVWLDRFRHASGLPLGGWGVLRTD